MGLLYVIAIGVLTITGFALGATLAGNRPALSRADRRELSARREFMSEVYSQVGEHMALGDPFATIVMDEFKKYQRENNKGATG